ncbi:helix-turn-helix domain-containing protein [Cytophagaceae bacterium DM2B3-1]|uniref:Helix-turn-helix domain-containing protein n=2 Tax=Xanthocytophaga TaxID=3078918 RepID=A0ABT7CLY8_9BACT|nr:MULTISPECIES: helix-turn-helix domain-containing protein [Xanthocytophaga]MDJ1493659.1 helix-turn-helix domain-containing protein [Xanthocytophaga flavus]MDJ1506411.1 helix-turn-helix domain-containing protein [Xanthocytophaga agilis]
MSTKKREKKEEISCPVEYAVTLLSGKWKLRILHALIKESPKRFKVLEREITGITPTMLTSQLRELEEDGLVSREIFPTVPPTVEYSLTEFGQTTIPMMQEIKVWGLRHKERNQVSENT